MKSTSFRFLLVLFFIASFNVNAQKKEEFTPTLNWSGFTNMWIGYVERDSLAVNYGFIPRHVRFKAFGKLTPSVDWVTQISFDKGIASLLDIFISYEPLYWFKIRFGQFPVPGIKSASQTSLLWSTTKMKLNDRPTISQNWNSNVALSGYRSGGLMVYGDILKNKLQYYAMMSMPHAGPTYYWNPSVKSPIYANDENGWALFSRVEYTGIENTEMGVSFHTESGTIGDTTKTKRNSYSLYFMTQQDRLYFMTEYIAGFNKQYINHINDSHYDYSGFFAESAYKITKRLEPALRYDYYIPTKGSYDDNGYKKYSNVTIGLNFYPTQNIALMTNYVFRSETPDANTNTINNDLFYLQLRYVFKQLNTRHAINH